MSSDLPKGKKIEMRGECLRKTLTPINEYWIFGSFFRPDSTSKHGSEISVHRAEGGLARAEDCAADVNEDSVAHIHSRK